MPKNQPKLDVDKITISDHALDQFMERMGNALPDHATSPAKRKRRYQAEVRGEAAARKMMAGAVRHRRRNAALQIMKNRFTQSEYWLADGWVFVINEEQDTLITAYQKSKGQRNKIYVEDPD